VALQLRAQKLAEERDAAAAERVQAIADAACMQAMLKDAGRFIEHLKKENQALEAQLHLARFNAAGDDMSGQRCDSHTTTRGGPVLVLILLVCCGTQAGNGNVR